MLVIVQFIIAIGKIIYLMLPIIIVNEKYVSSGIIKIDINSNMHDL